MSKLRNKFEKRIAAQLRRAHVHFGYETARIPYVLTGYYIPDFSITSDDGTTIYIETKGYLRPEHKRKMAAVKKQHPDKDIRILFYSYREKDIKWAEKIKMPWAVEKIPKEWLQ